MAPDSMALIGAGASVCASGSHVCRGNVAILTQNPISSKAKMSIIMFGGILPYTPGRESVTRSKVPVYV